MVPYELQTGYTVQNIVLNILDRSRKSFRLSSMRWKRRKRLKGFNAKLTLLQHRRQPLVVGLIRLLVDTNSVVFRGCFKCAFY